MLPSSESNLSAPAMSNLSWLNPTPHATAVYASCSALLPPHATLASRRPATALPGPDSHRLIAPALAGAFLLDHLVGGHEQTRRHGQAERLRRFEVDDRFELGRRLHRKIGRFVAAQDAVDIGRPLPIHVDVVGPVGHETTGGDEQTLPVDRRQTVPGRERNDEIAV